MSAGTEDSGRVVVGFDGSEGAKRALRWAAEEARSRGASLRVVHAWIPGEFGSDQEQELIAKRRLDEGIEESLGDDSDLRVERVTEKGHATRVLMDQTSEADMLVVGSRGHGGFAELLLGSVAQHVSTHSRAAVVAIVRR